MNFLYILLTLFVISVLALLHELGHYLTARTFGVGIKEFAVGMGPKVISRASKKTGIVYSLRLFPIGGFVSMVGEDEDSDADNALNKKPVWQRMIITVAGSLMNIITGVVLMAVVVSMSPGLGGTTVAKFDEGATSVSSGLSLGDEIVRVDGTRVHVAAELSYEIMHSGDKPIDLVVRRDGELVTLEDVVFSTVTAEGVVFGMPDFFVAREDKNVGNIIKHSFYRSISTVKMIWESLIDLITGRYGFEAVSGPVGVAGAVSDAAKSGLSDFLYLVVVIAMNLGVFNLLPFPALDGGRLFFQLIELIRRKPIKPEFEGYVHFAGIVLLLLLMVVVTLKDIIKLFA